MTKTEELDLRVAVGYMNSAESQLDDAIMYINNALARRVSGTIEHQLLNNQLDAVKTRKAELHGTIRHLEKHLS